jgi:hypothetical protein
MYVGLGIGEGAHSLDIHGVGGDRQLLSTGKRLSMGSGGVPTLCSKYSFSYVYLVDKD